MLDIGPRLTVVYRYFVVHEYEILSIQGWVDPKLGLGREICHRKVPANLAVGMASSEDSPSVVLWHANTVAPMPCKPATRDQISKSVQIWPVNSSCQKKKKRGAKSCSYFSQGLLA